jgi:hypothetical protein
MSFAYYSLALTVGAPLIKAQTQSLSRWTTPQSFLRFLASLEALDFANYDARRRAFSLVSRLPISQFFYTYPIDPLLEPVLPVPQIRFPATGTYILLDSENYLAQFAELNAALSYRDSDGPIAPALLQFQTALATLSGLYTSSDNFFDQVSWELSIPVLWLLYPPVIPLS